MSSLPGPVAGPPGGPLVAPAPPGRGLVVAGAILLAVSLVGGFVGGIVAVNAFDVASFEREVVIDGPPEVVVPGTIDFEVYEPLDDDAESAMTVGVAVEVRNGPQPVCAISDEDGEQQGSRAVFDTALLNDPGGSFEVVAAARVEPGRYVAECGTTGEPSAFDARFTVGRTLGSDDLQRVIGPAFGLLGVVAVAGLLFIVGLVLLIVGLVRRNRGAGGPPTGPPGPYQPWQQPQWQQPPPPWEQPPPADPPPWRQPPGPPGSPTSYPPGPPR